MLSEERRNRIVEIVDTHGAVSLDRLSQMLPVSRMTLWRDLKQLAAKGAVRRVHGGVVRVEVDESDERQEGPEPPFIEKSIVNLEEKRRIARFAAERYVEDNDVVILEGGTTVMQIVRAIERRNVTVVTHALNTLVEAARRGGEFQVISAGGILREPSFTFVGPAAVEFFETITAKTLFLSGTALDERAGLTDPNPLEIEVKQAMIRAAERVVLCMDSSKIGKRSLGIVLPFSEIRTVITDDGVPEVFLERARAAGIAVDVV